MNDVAMDVSDFPFLALPEIIGNIIWLNHSGIAKVLNYLMMVRVENLLEVFGAHRPSR